MDRRFIATLALRLLGIYVLIQALVPFGYIAGLLVEALRSDGFGLEWVLSSVGQVVVLAVLGLALLLGAPALAGRWVDTDEGEPEAERPTSSALEVLGYRLLGVYAILTSLPSFLSQVAGHLALASMTGQDFMTRDLLTSILGTLIGLWLLFGARGLAGLVERVRGAGLQESEKAWHSPKP